ncbi:MAG: trimethylamine methyltransferase family protein, partial [Methyloligellaceae bacterium]
MTSPEPETASGTRTRRRGRKKADDGQPPVPSRPPVWPGTPGGAFQPLSTRDMERIHDAVLDVLETVGLAEAPDFVADRVVEKGGVITANGRLTFPRALVDDAIAGACRNFVLHGQTAGHELELSGTNVYFGSGGAAPGMIDLESGTYREATLRDLYDAARTVDALDNIHFFARSVVARDMPTPRDLDINTAYACLRGTAKHVFVSASAREHIEPIVEMCATIAGGADACRDRPFLSVNINHVVPPLRFDAGSCAVMEECALRGIPFQVNSFDQVGASAPASLAGAVVQTMVESLAGLIVAWLVNPEARAILG